MQKKIITILITSLLILTLIIAWKCTYQNKYKNLTSNIMIAAYINGKASNDFPSKELGYIFDKIECTNGADISWDSANWGFSISEDIKDTTCNIYFTIKQTYE